MGYLAADLKQALDPVALAQAGGLDPDPWQVSVLRSSVPRILLLCSRQTGKSTVTAFRALHRAVYYPGSTILLIAPGLRQSQELFKKVVAAYQHLGRPVFAEGESSSTLYLANGSRVISLPGGNAATVRAYSAVSLICIDEAARVNDELVAALRPMLAVSGGSLLSLSTPAGKRGWFYRAWDAEPGWFKVRVSAADCPRITAEFLAEELLALGEVMFRQEYLVGEVGDEWLDAPERVFGADAIKDVIVTDFEPLFRGDVDVDE